MNEIRVNPPSIFPIICNTLEDYKNISLKLEKLGWRWPLNKLPTNYIPPCKLFPITLLIVNKDEKIFNCHSNLNEIKRLQKLAGINEIRVNKPPGKPSLTYEDALKLSAINQELFNYIKDNYNPDIQSLRINKTSSKHIISVSKKNNDPKLLELLQKYISFKNRFKTGIDEIKIQNPIISSEKIVDLYDKIDEYIQLHWNYDEEPDDEDNPEIIALDKELDKIMEEYDSRFETGFSDIKAYISKDSTKNRILFNKLKELDSKINYNNP